MKNNKIEIIGSGIVIFILMTFLVLSMFSASSALLRKTNTDQSTYMDFSQIYPFSEKQEVKTGIINKYTNVVSNIKENVEKATSTKLRDYNKMVELSYIYNKVIDYDLVSNTSGDSRIKVEGDYLIKFIDDYDVSSNAMQLIAFNDYLKDNNIDLLYVQAPFKTSRDQEISPIYKDFSNDNIDKLLKGIDGKVDYIDLRDNIKNNQYNYLSLFYKTDHHWLPTTGLWATNVISKYLNNNYDLNLYIENINMNNLRVKTYSNVFFGSDGRYVTLVNAKPENFDLILPKYDTQLSVKIYDKEISKTGTYAETLIDDSQIQHNDYYNQEVYSAYAYGNRSLIEVHNELVNNNKKVLLIKDSFAQVVTPFLALENEYTSIIDLRYFNGSLKSYIKKYQPDIVLVLYNGNIVVDMDKANYTSADKNMWKFE